MTRMSRGWKVWVAAAVLLVALAGFAACGGNKGTATPRGTGLSEKERATAVMVTDIAHRTAEAYPRETRQASDDARKTASNGTQVARRTEDFATRSARQTADRETQLAERTVSAATREAQQATRRAGNPALTPTP